MARKRMLDPMLWDDPDLTQLSPLERLLFIGLISLADDYGHIAAHPALLRKWVFGYDDLSTAEVKGMRDRILSCCRNIELYSVGGQEYIWLRTWDRHQDLRFRAKGQYPCHCCGRYHEQADYKDCPARSEEEQQNAKPSRISYADIAHISSPDYVESCRSKDILGEEKTVSPVAPNGAEPVEKRPKKRRTEQEPPEGFPEFWADYPKHADRAESEKVYRQTVKAGVDPPALLVAARNYKLECQLVGREPRYICHASTFLRKRRFEEYQQPPDPEEFAPQIISNARASPQTKLQRSQAAADRLAERLKQGGTFLGPADDP